MIRRALYFALFMHVLTALVASSLTLFFVWAIAEPIAPFQFIRDHWQLYALMICAVPAAYLVARRFDGILREE